jgi:Tol biopolymer transport system component
MALASGTRLGTYQIVGLIGAGGMGEVYRAVDTRLERQVAIKILPDVLRTDPERGARFGREAKLLAALNHPNIATIHGLEQVNGEQFIVMELVEGETLADRIARGPLPIHEALPIAKQIGEALDAAHEHAIIHRDLKPANIKFRPDGTVKVLDFGLAKAFTTEQYSPSPPALTNSPTLTSPINVTGVGVLLGTAAYMSPEQVRGRAVDKRADIWAFGCVLFEMLSGTRAFASEHDSVTDVLAAVLKSEPDWSALPADTPGAVRKILRRCLTKDPRERLRDIGDLRFDLRDGEACDTSTATPHLAFNRLAWMLVAALGIASLALASAFLWTVTRPAEPPAVYRSVILPPTGNADAAASEARTGVPRFGRGLALSPDGQQLALVAPGLDGRLVLWVRRLDGTSTRPLPGTESASSPFWSPDGRHVAFVAEGKLKRIEVSGGPVLTLTERARNFSTGTWNRDNVVLFAGDGTIFRVPAGGGAASPVTSRDATVESPHDSPFFLPDGRHFLYAVTEAGGGAGSVYVGTLDSGERVKLVAGGSLPAYANGFLLFVRDDTLMAQRFDADRLELSGEPLPLAEQLLVGGAPSSSGVFAVSQSGVLVYQSGVISRSILVWLDRNGKALGTLTEPRAFSYVQLSPDGRQLAVSVSDEALRTRDIWLYDTIRGGQTRLTSEATDDFSPTWAPSSDRVAFAARRSVDQSLNVYETSANGTGGEKRLLDRDGVEIPTSWSADGRFVLFQTPSPGADIMVLSLDDGNASPLVSTRFTEGSAQFSPDGRWVAYSSNETGRTEVYVMPFQRTGPRTPISTEGGGSPRWRRDGKELFYLRGDNTLVGVAVTLSASSLEVGQTTPLFNAEMRTVSMPYDVAGDGRFIVNRSLDAATPAAITLVVNWPASLEK